jgi:hypothetical protein
MGNDKKTPLTEGIEKRGGKKPKPSTPRPDVKPIPLKPSKDKK